LNTVIAIMFPHWCYLSL